MKTRILLILLVVSSLSYGQNWSQVGAPQFTDFADTAEITFDASGQPYLVYHNPANQEVKVEKFDGNNWVSIGGVVSTQGHNNLTININPVTQEPWVALKRSASGTGSTVDVFRYDGSSWVSEGTSIYFNSGLYSYGIQMQFDSSGNPRLAGVIGGGAGRQAAFATFVSTNNWNIDIGRSEPNLRLDFTDYDNYFYSEHVGSGSSYQGYIRKHTVLNNTNADEFVLGYYPSRTLEVSGIAGTNYFVTNDTAPYNATTNPTPYPDLIFGNGDTNTAQPQPLNTINNTNNILKFRESSADNNLYLMFSDNNENLVFQKYNVSGQFWTVLPSIGLVTSTANFFTSMETNPVNGDMYVTYLDGGKVSVKSFSIQTPLSKYYVNANVSGGNGSGDSWTNASTSLSDALNAAGTTTTEIWVAAGTYKPSITARSATFNIAAENIQIYGGFDGTETSVLQRDLINNQTILSGDLNGDDTGVDFTNSSRSDNSYHVVSVSGNGIVLDGLEIKDGHANGSAPNGSGSGLLVAENVNNLTLKNCKFLNNMGLTGGAIRASFNINAVLTIENCVFDNNLSRYGSGLYLLVGNNRTATVDITNTLFTNSRSANNGSSLGYTGSAAWIRASGSNSSLTTTITNCTFANNTDIGTQAGSERGTLSLARRTDGSSTHNATINNSIFYNNEGASNATTLAVNKGHVSMPNLTVVNNSIDEDNFSNLTYLTNTSSFNPLFTDAGNNDYTLTAASPAINAGDNSKVPTGINADLLFNQRIFNTTVDMGPYEYGSTSTLNTATFEEQANMSLFPNPTSSKINIRMNNRLNKAEIFNLVGQKVIESKLTSIDVSRLRSGVYLILIEDINGIKTSKRFVKK